MGTTQTGRKRSRSIIRSLEGHDLVSMQAGLRATALAALPWAMVPEAHGQIAEALQVQQRAGGGAALDAAGPRRRAWPRRVAGDGPPRGGGCSGGRLQTR